MIKLEHNSKRYEYQNLTWNTIRKKYEYLAVTGISTKVNEIMKFKYIIKNHD